MQLAGDLRRAGFQPLDGKGQVIDRCLVERKAVDLGLPGVARVKLDAQTPWPANLDTPLPE